MEDKETILSRMLGNIDNSYDKSKGQFFYDVIMPVAIELEKLKQQADEILTKGFADTSTGENLDRIVSEVGIERKEATKSTGYVTITGINGSKINKGEIVASDTVNFVFLEDLKIENKTIDVLVECEKDGIIGNVPLGAIKYLPKTIQGLQTVANKQAFTNGYDTEDDESLRDRYYTKVKTPATSGNVYHYINWTKEVTGVGDCKVIPLWDKNNGMNGNGTVKIIVINANKTGADESLVNNVKAHIEENRPIGAAVTIISALEKSINVTCNLILEAEYELVNVKSSIETTIKNYLKEIAFNKNYVSFAKIGAFILDTAGVQDYSNLLVNNGADNITIENEEVAVLGGVTIG